MYFQDMTASYDPTKGLSLSVPVAIYDGGAGFANAARLDLLLNQSSGVITASLTPGGE
jgi:hypothetical protein